MAEPALKIRDRIVGLKRVRASELIPNPKNWRDHPREQREALGEVLAKIGYADALLARETPAGFMLIDGHLRANMTPEQEVPVLLLDVDEKESDLLLATLDPLASMARALDDKLLSLRAELDIESEALNQQLDKYARGGMDIVEDDVPEPPKEAVTKPGDLWLLGEHRLLCGDATSETDVARVMDGGLADCVFTSPPYAFGIDYGPRYEDTIENLRAMLPKLAALWLTVVVDGGFAVVNFGDLASGARILQLETRGEGCEYPMALEYWPIFRACGWLLWSRRVWCKKTAAVYIGAANGTNRAVMDWENVWTWRKPGEPIVGYKGPDSMHGWVDTSHLGNLEIGKETHGAGMHVALPARMLTIHSRQGEVIFEPFAGTGTTVSAAEQVGRACCALELEPRYCDVIVERWQNLSGKKATRKAL